MTRNKGDVLVDKRELWEKTVDFHGHICPGLTIGYKAALYSIELLDLKLGGGGNAGCLSPDEEIVCIAENDSCSVDAIQVILGCSVGKGNLLFHMRGKQAYSFFNRKNGQSIRLMLKPGPEGMSRAESLDYYQGLEPSDMFDIKPVTLQLPIKAKLFESYICDCCGESTGANWIRIRDGKKVCLDCYESYDRFNV